MKNFWKKLLCKHSYEKISWYMAYDSYRNVVYSRRLYKCTKCGKQIDIDGRK